MDFSLCLNRILLSRKTSETSLLEVLQSFSSLFQNMESQNERVEQVNATKIDQEMKWKELEGRILNIETRLSGMQKGMLALTFLCFVILIINIDWKNMTKYDSEGYWNYSPIQILVAVIIFVCIVIFVCKMCSRESASAEDAFFKKQSGIMVKSV